MSEYINREEFLESKIYLYCHDCSRRKNRKGEMVYEIGDAPCKACGIGDVLDDVIDFPSADVVERRKGKWLCERLIDWETANIPGVMVYASPKCSICGETFLEQTNYCPNCGADMREKADV